MTLEHVAIWTNQIEALKEYYVEYFDAIPNEIYTNPKTKFQSYFLSFNSGAQLELMQKPGIPENQNDIREAQYRGIIHLAFGLAHMNDVDKKAEQLQKGGFEILNGPRKTGDGYYEIETLDLDGNRLEVTTMYTF